MTPQQRMGPLAEAEGEADRLRDEAELDGELERGPYVEKIRCDDCGWEAETSRETVGGRWDEHKQRIGCQRYTLLWKGCYVDEGDDDG